MKTMNCIECDIVFEYQTSKRKYCSDYCKFKARRKNSADKLREYNKIWHKRTMAKRREGRMQTCMVCSKQFVPHNGILKKRTCSPECKRKRMREHDKNWRSINREQYLEQSRIRDRLRTGTEKRHSSHKRHYEKHKVKKLAYKRAQRILEPEKVKAWEKKKYWNIKNNPEKYAIYKKKINDKYNERYNTDTGFQVRNRLKSLVLHAFNKYSTDGKVKPSRKYGIDYQKIFEHLGPCPGDIKDYEIDHVMPLSLFNFNRQDDVKEAFKPSNHQWLLASENQSKNNILPIAILFDEKLWT